jgi:hypothetical protein
MTHAEMLLHLENAQQWLRVHSALADLCYRDFFVDGQRSTPIT